MDSMPYDLVRYPTKIQDASEYAECEAVVKDFLPFKEAMKKRGIEDMDLVMVDPWYELSQHSVGYCTVILDISSIVCSLYDP